MNTIHPYQHLSVLQNATLSAVVKKPYPFIVLENALPQALADTLTEQFPVELFNALKENYQKQHGEPPNNKRMDISLAMSRMLENVPEIWRQFLEYHSSQHFFDHFLMLFGDAVMNQFKSEFPEPESLQKLKLGIFQKDNLQESDLLMNTAMSINTPVLKKSSVRAIHTDHGDKLFSGLYYLRRPQDNSTGGNLQVLKWKDNYSQLQKRFFYEEGVDPKHTELIKEIPYGNNTFIMFINSIDALHSVTPREVTGFDRTFVNFIGVYKSKLFRKELSIAKKIRKWTRKKSDTTVEPY
jgi:hypothetical protein